LPLREQLPVPLSKKVVRKRAGFTRQAFGLRRARGGRRRGEHYSIAVKRQRLMDSITQNAILGDGENNPILGLTPALRREAAVARGYVVLGGMSVTRY
jgi:hypothetical protein